MCVKYKPFFNHDLNDSKKTLKKVLEIQQDLGYNISYIMTAWT